ncbi:MAG: hypothetical protein ABL903_08100 [Methylococcales bacterium]
MLGTIAALLIAYWFYKTAEAKAKNPLSAAILGFVVYLIPAATWTFVVTPSIRNSVEHSPNFLLALLAQYAYILVAVACAAFVHFRHFAAPNSNQ